MSRLLAFLISVVLPLGSLLLLRLVIPVSASIYTDSLTPQLSESNQPVVSNTVLTGQAIPPLSVLLTPAQGATLTETDLLTFDWDNGGASVVSYTLVVTGEDDLSSLIIQGTASVTTPDSFYTATQILPNGLYTWTVQAHDATGEVSGYTQPFTFTLQMLRPIFLPFVMVNPPLCPQVSAANFELIPIEGNRTDRPDFLHGDLNLAQRGYSETNADKTLKDFSGSTDPGALQLSGLFNPNGFPGISTVYRVNGWNWGCGAQGCPTGPIANPLVTLMGLNAVPGQPIYIPDRGDTIYPGSYKAMVLYAEETRITLGYTRQDSVANGYAVHLENICVDPNLLALYQAQIGPDGYRKLNNGAYRLPALRNDQALGTALGQEIGVAIRDRGSFLDPRSRKDWWRGF
jgi:hypothetical protein